MAQRNVTHKSNELHSVFLGVSQGVPLLPRRSRQRRGVLLLVCLVLLVMFLMLGVTFVLTAGNFRRSSEAYQRMLERPSADLPERSGDLLDSVAHDLVRGTTNQDSPFAKENLLEDLYGRAGTPRRCKFGGPRWRWFDQAINRINDYGRW